MAQSLRNIPWIRQQAEMAKAIEANARYAGSPRGTVRGTIISVEDPEDLGRVKVLFDAMNPQDIPSVEGAGEFSLPRPGESSNLSHWLDVSPAFKGKQPKSLEGKRVNISLSNGEYHYAVLQDVLYDPQNLTDGSQQALQIPSNSTMTRLPIYEAGGLPPACKENHGCTVVEENGPMNSDWVCICLKRDGQYIWVRHADLAHGHAGGNDVTSQVDSAGNRLSPGQMAATYDHVFVTSHQEMKKEGRTGYSTAPAGNPWGSAAAWAPPPMSTIQAFKFVEGPLFSQDTALSFARNSGFIDNITGSFITTYNPDILAAVESVPGSNFTKTAIQQAQKVLNFSEVLRKVIADPTDFVKSAAEKSLPSYVPGATKFVISTLQNPAATIKTVFSKLPTLPSPFK
jgi:hypothetical protein